MEEQMMTRSSSFSTFILIILMLFSASGLVFAQGMVAGRVTDGSTGDYLPGANVMLEGTTMGAATDREGFFMIANVPEGSYNLVINYIGYEDYSTEVSVSGSERVVLDEIGLTLSAMETDVIVVEGQLEGQMKALNQQRVAPNIKNVVSREQMEQFPDYTTADAVRRLPGVYISRDQGEGRYVLVRGTEPRLSNVKVNGEELATSRQEERYSQLDIIGSNQAASIEVVKALTPDMDGDAIGGTVNLVTRSAFDYAGRRLRVTAGAGYANLRGTALYQGKLSYSDRFLDNKNFGLTITANWDRTDKGQHNSEKEYGDESDRSQLDLADADLRDYYNLRDRYGFGASLEYRVNPQHRFFIGGMYNRFDDEQWRARSRYRFDRGDYSSDGTLVTGARNVIESSARDEIALQTQLSGGGVHQFDQFLFDWKVAHSSAKEEADPMIESEWEVRGTDWRLDYSDPKFPIWTQTNPDEGDVLNDPDIFELGGMEWRHRKATDMNIVGALNFTIPLTITGMTSDLKFGGKVRIKEKDRGDTRIGYSWEGDDPVTLGPYATIQSSKDFLRNNYVFGPTPDTEAIEKFFYEQKDVNLIGEEDIGDTRGQKYNAKENIYAGYAMMTVSRNDVMHQFGFRYESTHNDYEGALLLYDDEGNFFDDDIVKAKRDYGLFLPMIHTKWQFERMGNIRFALTRTMARPNYWDLVPFIYVFPEDEEIERGNPDLDVTTSWNFDLMAEYYFTGVGVLSGGVFYKDLNDIIFIGTQRVEGGEFDGYREETPLNGGKASLWGMELNWQQQLTFLPGMWAGLGIYANYTKTWAKSDLVEEVREGEDFLPGQAGDIANLALSYEWGPLTSRVSLMYQGKYLLEVGGEADGSEDIWNDNFFTIDVSAAYKIIPQLDIFAEFVNVTDAPDVEYIGVADRPVLQEYTDWWMRAGLKFSL
jgi:TonB-dependent receptor